MGISIATVAVLGGKPCVPPTSTPDAKFTVDPVEAERMTFPELSDDRKGWLGPVYEADIGRAVSIVGGSGRRYCAKFIFTF